MSENTNANADANNAEEPDRPIAIVAGPDEEDLAGALIDRGAGVERIEGIANREALERAGIINADLFVLTDVVQATSIPVAKEGHPTLQVVVYTHDSLPDFASRQADLLVDPALLGPDAVAEELLA